MDVRVLFQMSGVFSLWARREDSMARKSWMGAEIWDVFHPLVLHSSEVSIKGVERDSAWEWDRMQTWVDSPVVCGYIMQRAIRMWKQEIQKLNGRGWWGCDVPIHYRFLVFSAPSIQLLFPLTVCKHCLFRWVRLSRHVGVVLYVFSAVLSVELQWP